MNRPPSAHGPSAAPAHATARSAALSVLETIERDGCTLDDAMHRVRASMPQALSDPRDRALFMELVHGVLRHRLRLDWRLDQVANRPMDRLPRLVAAILRLGAYQLLQLTKIPPSAAVNEAVTLARRRAPAPHWAGFVNAVLRALLRAPAPLLPEIEQDPVEALSICYSCPPWLVERWCEQWGVEQAEQLCRQTCEAPPLTLRVNQLRISREALRDRWAAAGITAVPTAISPSGLHVQHGGSPANLPGYDEGLFYVEDEAAHLIPLIVAPQPGERVLDACAAPGGKALHVEELMLVAGSSSAVASGMSKGQTSAALVAVDRNESRLRVLRENIQRLGATLVTPTLFDWVTGAQSDAMPAALRTPFDRVLLDAPCSATGILRRHPEGKWQKQAGDLAEHARVQQMLLDRTSRLLRPGGVIVYSTCSTEPEETTQIIDGFCASHSEWVRESVADSLPSAAHPWVTDRGELCTAGPARRVSDAMPMPVYPLDGFFAARLRRRS